MAQESIDNLKVIQFSAQLHLRAQQMRARLRPLIEIRRMNGERMAYDGLGLVEAREVSERFSDVVFDSIEHNRREIIKRRFVIALPVDKNDVDSMLLDPKGYYAQQALAGMERAFDHTAYDAMFADVRTGKEFTTTISAATDGVLTVNATSGVTLDSWLQIGQNFIDGEVGNDSPVDISVGVTGEEHRTLLQIQEFTNLFYAHGYALEKGQLVNAAGINIIKFGGGSSLANPLLAVSGGVRTSFAMATAALCCGMSREVSVKYQPRTDKLDTDQLIIDGVWGMVRTEGKLIQKYTTTV